MAMKLSDKMRKRASVNMPIYGERVYAWIEEVAQLEEELEFCKRYMDDMEIVLNGDGNHSKEFTQVFRVAKLTEKSE